MAGPDMVERARQERISCRTPVTWHYYRTPAHERPVIPMSMETIAPDNRSGIGFRGYLGPLNRRGASHGEFRLPITLILLSR